MGLKHHNTLERADRIKRPGIGHVAKAAVTSGDVYDGLKDGVIRYAPKYQRGWRGGKAPDDEADWDVLLEMNPVQFDPSVLRLDEARAWQMAAKYLSAKNKGTKKLFNTDLLWNSRRDKNHPERDPRLTESRELELFTTLTLPDSGHRHYACFLLGAWKARNPQYPIPARIELEEGGETVSDAEIKTWLETFDPYDAEESSVYVEVYNLTPEEEGELFDEFNDLAKRPDVARSIAMNEERNPSRRFIKALRQRCRIFGSSEIEFFSNTLGSKSRKLTTIATLESAVRPVSRFLYELEEDAKKRGRRNRWEDLIAFVSDFYEEWAKHYPEFLPTASADDRNKLRKVSIALSNIMFFPMFQLAFELWKKYDAAGTDWRGTSEWRDGLARLAGDVSVNGKKVRVMARDNADDPDAGNPEWRKRIFVPKYDDGGNRVGWVMSSTRNTREAAFHYLVQIADVKLPPSPTKKAPKGTGVGVSKAPPVGAVRVVVPA
jgi:hypothetical protein